MPRVLGFYDLSVLASAAMGPAYSLAVTMGPMVAVAGANAMTALALIAGIMLCIAIAFAQLSRVLPDAGSSFSWIARAYGPALGTYAAWLLLLSNFFATMTTALPAAAYTLDLFAPNLASSPLYDALVAVVWIFVSTVLLSVGLRPTAFTTALFLLAEFVVIGVSAVAALLIHPSALHVAPAVVPVLPNPVLGIVTAMVLGIWMIDGWEVSASASEEAAGSAENPGRGGIVGLLATTAILLFAMFAYLRIGDVAGFSAHQDDAMSYVAERLGGGVWRITIVATVLVSTAATLWTTILYLSRSTYAMGRDGVLPRGLGVLDSRGLPANALLVVSLGVSVFTLLTGFSPTAASALNLVLTGTSVFLGALFCMSALAALKLLSDTAANRFTSFGVPLLGAIALAGIIAVNIAQSDANTRGVEIGGLVLGIPFSLWRGRSVRPAHG